MESAASKDQSFYLKKDDQGALHLDHGHSYYYQVQTQMFVCDVTTVTFVCALFLQQKGKIFHHTLNAFAEMMNAGKPAL